MQVSVQRANVQPDRCEVPCVDGRSTQAFVRVLSESELRFPWFALAFSG